MILLASSSITINKPVDVVFNYLINMENYHEWYPGVIKVDSQDELNCETVGKIYKEHLSIAGNDAAMFIEVAQCDKNRLFLMQGQLAEILTQMTVEFTEVAEAYCEVHLKYHCRNAELDSTSEIIISLRDELGVRTHDAAKNLKGCLEKHIKGVEQ